MTAIKIEGKLASKGLNPSSNLKDLKQRCPEPTSRAKQVPRVLSSLVEMSLKEASRDYKIFSACIQLSIRLKNAAQEIFDPNDDLDFVRRSFEKLGVNVEDEFEAIKSMMKQAAGEGVSKQDAKTYFQKQYGYSKFEQMMNLSLEFARLPHEILKNSDITKAFITKDFIKIWNAIELLKDPTEIKLEEGTLYRFPNNIKKHHASLKILSLQCGLQSLPAGMQELTNLQHLIVGNNALQRVPLSLYPLFETLQELVICGNPMDHIPDELKESKIRKILHD